MRSERQLMERLDLATCCSAGSSRLGIDDAVWDRSTFSKNRDRLLAGDTAAAFLAQVPEEPRVRRLLSSERFGVDGSLAEAWALDEELPARGQLGRAADGQPRVPPRVARQRQPCLDHRPR